MHIHGILKKNGIIYAPLDDPICKAGIETHRENCVYTNRKGVVVGRIGKLGLIHIQYCSVQFRCSVMSNSLWPHELQHAWLSCPSPTQSHSNSRSSCRWCHPIISSSVIPFSSHLPSFPASGTIPMGQFFMSGGQNIGVSASASVLPMNIQVWFPLGWTGWTSLKSKGLSRVFSNTTVQKHQFFSAQLSM